MERVLVTGVSGFLGSHVARLPASARLRRSRERKEQGQGRSRAAVRSRPPVPTYRGSNSLSSTS